MINEDLCRHRCHVLQLLQLGRIANAALEAQLRLRNNRGRCGTHRNGKEDEWHNPCHPGGDSVVGSHWVADCSIIEIGRSVPASMT